MASRITPLDKRIAARLRSLRDERGASQPVVAGALGVSYQSYQKMEGGRVSFRASTLEKLAALFSVPVPYFLGDNEAPNIDNAAEVVHISAIVQELDAPRAKNVLRYALEQKQAG